MARTGGTSFTALLLCAHPHKQRLPQTLHTLGLGQRAGSYGRTRGGVDYLGLASQLIMQRDTKQEGTHTHPAPCPYPYPSPCPYPYPYPYPCPYPYP